MTPAEIRNAVRALQAKGHSLREISRSLALSRNTVRRILRQPDRTADEAAPCDEATLVRLKAAFERARGNGVRVQELLADDGLQVRYSTLTRWAGRRACAVRRGAPANTTSRPGRRCSTTPRRIAWPSPRRGGRQDRHRAMRRAGAGLFAPAVHSVLSAVHPLRGQNVPARGGPLHGWRLPGLRHRQHQRPARRRLRRRCRHRPRDGRPSPEPLASGSAPTGWAIPTEKAGSNGPSPMSKTTSWRPATSRTSTT